MRACGGIEGSKVNKMAGLFIALTRCLAFNERKFQIELMSSVSRKVTGSPLTFQVVVVVVADEEVGREMLEMSIDRTSD